MLHVLSWVINNVSLFYTLCYYFSMPGLKSIRVRKVLPCYHSFLHQQRLSTDTHWHPSITDVYRCLIANGPVIKNSPHFPSDAYMRHKSLFLLKIGGGGGGGGGGGDKMAKMRVMYPHCLGPLFHPTGQNYPKCFDIFDWQHHVFAIIYNEIDCASHWLVTFWW